MIRILTLALAFTFFIQSAAVSQQSDSPNIILVMSDDQGWGDVGFNGNKVVQTPHLDSMAANGVKFNRFYAAAPLCSPTRGSCLTGRFPFRFGILAAHTSGMRVGEVTVAEILKKKGYKTGFFGKWHIGWVKHNETSSRGHYSPPSHHGYEEVFATTSAVPTWNPTVTPEGWKSNSNKPGQPWKGGAPYVHNGEEVTDNMQGDDSRIIMDRVIPFIDENSDKPFFATVWFHTPHEPVVAGEEYQKLYPNSGRLRKNYYGCITAMDEQIGRLRSRLRELKIEKNTVIFFCSDNGPGDSLAKKKVASSGPFRGHKHQMYDGGILVPACAEWPGVIQPETTTDVRCSTIDYLPTIAKIVDDRFSAKYKRPIDGIDLMPVIQGQVTQRESDLFFGFRRLHDGIDGKAIISGHYKLLTEASKTNAKTRMFDLQSDPYEKTDIAAQKPNLFQELSAKLEAIDGSCQRSRDGADYSY
ncbi:MAG: sulfatase-like hydrolase/transferase [Fuerstiella sp.]